MNPNKSPDEAFLEEAAQLAARLINEEQLEPMALFHVPSQNRPGELTIAFANLTPAFASETAKQHFESVAPQIAAEFKAVRVAVITEAWMLNIDGSDPADAELHERYLRGEFRLADLPNEKRTEIVTILVQSRKGTSIGVSYEIVDDPVRSLGRSLDPAGPIRIESRWNFFPPAFCTESTEDEQADELDVEDLRP